MIKGFVRRAGTATQPWAWAVVDDAPYLGAIETRVLRRGTATTWDLAFARCWTRVWSIRQAVAPGEWHSEFHV